MQLSTNFRLSEFTRSDTAKRLGIVNECSSVEQILNLAGGPTPIPPCEGGGAIQPTRGHIGSTLYSLPAGRVRGGSSNLLNY